MWENASAQASASKRDGNFVIQGHFQENLSVERRDFWLKVDEEERAGSGRPMAMSWACSRLWWGTLALLIHTTASGNTASHHQMLRLCDRNVHFCPDAFSSVADQHQQACRRQEDDDPRQRQCPCWPSEAASRQPAPSRLALRLRGGRGGKARQIKTAKGGGKPMKGDTLRSMAPSINREEEENGGGGGLKGGKILKQRGKWENPHNPNRRLSIRQGRVQRANRDVQASCKAAVRHISQTKSV